MNVYLYEGRTVEGAPMRMLCREGTSDERIVRSVTDGDEYRLHGHRSLDQVVDVGAHIGSVAVSVALDHGARVLALEPVPESRALLAANAILNGVEALVAVDGRAVAVGVGYVRVDYGWDGDNAYVGALAEGFPSRRVYAPSVTLAAIVSELGGVDLLKVDCEGCERDLLRDADVSLRNVAAIAGEWHPAGRDPDAIRAALEQTHHVEVDGFLFFADPR